MTRATLAGNPLELGKLNGCPVLRRGSFGKSELATTKFVAELGVSYVLLPKIGESIVAHHNQLRPCPVPLEPGSLSG